MIWNLRIVQFTSADYGTWYEIREVYYDADGHPFGHCNASALGETIEEIKTYLAYMQNALSSPILYADSFVNFDADNTKFH